MKLGDGNVSAVSVCPRGRHVTIIHESLDLTVQGPPRHVQSCSTWTSLTAPGADIWWISLSMVLWTSLCRDDLGPGPALYRDPQTKLTPHKPTIIQN